MSIADNWEDGELFKELAELKVENAELKIENAALRKDKERLEYLLREYNIYRFGYERLTYDDIDEAMEVNND